MLQPIDPNRNDDRIIGAEAIAVALGVKASTVYGWSAQGSDFYGHGIMPIHTALGGRIFVYREDLDAFRLKHAPRARESAL